MSKNPFPGPQPYRASDSARFFGREDMAYRLEGSVVANRCVTVYGPSGAGKSSLMQASVIPTLIASHELRAVRVDGWPEDEDPTRWLASAMYAELGLGALPPELAPDEAIVSAAQRASRRSARLLLIYLDQMEQLLYASRPAAGVDAFFVCVQRLVEMPLRNVRVTLSLREDYLGRFRDRLRDRGRLLDHGFRVGPLTVAELSSAVCQAAASGDPPQTWSREDMNAMMLQVRVPGEAASDEAEAQAAYAQIVCRALFQERAGGDGEAGGIEAEPILRRYLEATLDDLGPLREPAQRLLEDHLVTEDGSRTLRTEAELLRIVAPDKLSVILRALEGAAILHAEQHQGSRYFELGHDWLARKVHQERQQREAQAEARRREEAQREDAARALARERKQRRRVLLFALSALVLSAIAMALGVWAWQQKQTAEAAGRVAEASRSIAAKQADLLVGAHDTQLLAAFRELSDHGQLAWALMLLPEVQHPEHQHDWIELANLALMDNALRVSLRGHQASLSVAAWSPDGKRVLTASADKTARVWSADGLGQPVLIKEPGGPITAAAWSPDGARLVTASDDGLARVWSADGKGDPVVLRGHEAAVVSAAWSPDGKRVVTASRDRTARVWAADGSGEAVVLKGHEAPLTTAVFLAAGARVLTTSEDTTARLWDLATPARPVILRGHTAAVSFAAVSLDGARVVTTSTDSTARVWGADGKLQHVLKGHQGSVFHAAWSPDGQRLATASADRTARVWSADGAGEPVVLAGHTLGVTSVAFRPDGKYLATGSADRTARLWRIDDGASLELRGHEAPVRSAAWSPDGAWVVTAAADLTERSIDHSARVWSAARLATLPHLRRGAGVVHAAFLDAEGQRVASTSDDGVVRVWRVDGAAEPVLLRRQDAWVAGATLSPDGTRVATASFDRKARVLRADGTGEPVVLEGHEAEVRFAAFAPDGHRVATAADDDTARLWSADGTGTPVVLAGHEDWLSSVAWAPDGRRVVTTSLDHTARVWSADGKGAPVVLAGHGGDVLFAAVSPDGRRVVTTSEDHTARVWSLDGGAPVVLSGHDGAVLRAVWCPDSTRVATQSADGDVRLWSADGGAALVVLETPALAMRFLDGGQKLLTVAADDAVRTWSFDVKALTDRLRTAHADCLPPELRVLYLGETTHHAGTVYASCERAHGREPIFPEGKAP